jgi:hypothetical protein
MRFYLGSCGMWTPSLIIPVRRLLFAPIGKPFVFLISLIDNLDTFLYRIYALIVELSEIVVLTVLS